MHTMKKRANHIKLLRLALGLTQRDMSTYLGIHHSQYTMAESGLRELPYAASMIVLQLQANLQSAPVEEQRSLLPAPDPQLQEWIDDEILNCRLQLHRAKQELEKLLQQTNANEMLLHTVTLSATARKNNGQSEPFRDAWLQQLALDKRQSQKPVAQVRLQFKIELLQYRLGRLEEMRNS